jgi:phage terminase large subunit-like protein
MSVRNILLLVKDPSKTANFLSKVMNLKIIHETDAYIEMNTYTEAAASHVCRVPIVIRVSYLCLASQLDG